MTRQTISIDDLKKAHERIKAHIHVTPIQKISLPKCDEVVLKLENFNPTGSFKDRGALNKLLGLKLEGKHRKIVATSAGNHSQAVSRWGRALGFDVTVTMPKSTPVTKVLSTERYGATVVLEGENFSDSLKVGKAISKKMNAPFVHAFDDPAIIMGQGTVGLEMVEQMGHLDWVLVPVGGGGLASGVALAIKHFFPKCKVIGVQVEACTQVHAAYHNKQNEPHKPTLTIADGIAIKTIGEHTLPMLKKNLDDLILVNDRDVAWSITHLLQHHKILSEGAGAVGVAALLTQKIKPKKGEKIGVVISGGNIDMVLLERTIQMNLSRIGRVAKLSIRISDQPGGLSRLASELANAQASILQIHHERSGESIPLFETDVEVSLELKGEKHLIEILDRLRGKGYSVKTL